MRLQDIVARFMPPPRPKAVQDKAWLQRIPPADAPPGCSSLFGTHVATNKACPFSYLADAVLEPMASDEGHIYVNARAIHRDPRGWNRPNEFLIDRWLPGGQHDTEPERRLFIPFGLGARSCVAASFASTILETFLRKVLSQRVVTNPSGDVPRIVEGSHAVLRRPFKLHFAERSPSPRSA